MKKITKKFNFKKMLGVAMLCLCINQILVAQCSLNASFTYTTGNSGLVNITNTSTGATSSTTYKWYYSDRAEDLYVTSPSHTFLYNGAYSIKLSMMDTLSNCFDS